MVVHAQNETADDLVNAVNALRALQGLELYQIDPDLMTYAQIHSNYQATIQTSTHLHSDGNLPQEIGLEENVAVGDIGVVTIAVVVYEIWADYGHRNILVGYSTGQIGAGVAFSDNGLVYYTVDVRTGDPNQKVTPVADASEPIVALVTEIPSNDGSITHKVENGQTLWSIAELYGVTVDEILRLNGITDQDAIINIGQKLLIRAAQVTATSTPPEVTATVSGGLGADQTVFPTARENLSETATPVQSKTTVPSTTETEQDNKNKLSGWIVLYSIGFFGTLVTALIELIKTNRR
jgi:LysM repeat protein